MPMGFGDRLFWSIASAVAIGIFWLKFVEPYLSIWFALGIAIVVAVLIWRKGGQPKKTTLKSSTSV